MQIAVQVLEQKQDTTALKTTAGTARTRSTEHEDNQDRLGKGRPEVKVRGCKTGRRDDGRHLEKYLLNSLSQTVEHRSGIDGDQDHAGKNKPKIQFQFFVL